MKKKLLIVALVIYALIVLMSTKALLDRNEYGVFETKNNYYYSGEVENYSKSSLLKFSKNVDYEKLVDKEIYYIDKDNNVSLNKLTSYDKEKETFAIDGEEYKKNHILGEVESECKVFGSIANIATSKGFYFVFVIIPIVILFMFEIYLLFKYVDYNKNRKGNNDEKIPNKPNKQNKKAV